MHSWHLYQFLLFEFQLIPYCYPENSIFRVFFVFVFVFLLLSGYRFSHWGTVVKWKREGENPVYSSFSSSLSSWVFYSRCISPVCLVTCPDPSWESLYSYRWFGFWVLVILFHSCVCPILDVNYPPNCCSCHFTISSLSFQVLYYLHSSLYKIMTEQNT